MRKGCKNQPLALKTKFGWTLFGTSVETEDIYVNAIHESKIEPEADEEESDESRSDKSLNDSLERFWTQESVGILPGTDTAMSIEDIHASKVLENETKLLDGRYEVPMLWRNAQSTLPNNVTMAKKRFSYLEKKLRSNSEF